MVGKKEEKHFLSLKDFGKKRERPKPIKLVFLKEEDLYGGEKKKK
jgi:hypothetical protein